MNDQRTRDRAAASVAQARGRKPCDPNPPAREGTWGDRERIKAVLAHPRACDLANRTTAALRKWLERLEGDTLRALTGSQRDHLRRLERQLGDTAPPAPLAPFLAAPPGASAKERGLPLCPPGRRQS